MKKFVLLLGSASAALSFTTPANAQEGAAASDTSADDDAIVVTGEREYLYREEDTEALGFDIPLAEVPATINVITEDFLEDVRAYDVEDVLTYVPGVITGGFSGGTSTTFLVRGFENTATYFNGLRQFRSISQTPSLDNIGRVEIVKGPSGVEFGVADAGGILNFVTLKPEREFSAEAFAGIGDFGYRRIGGDVTGPINDDGSLRYRVIAAYSERAEWRDGRPDETPRWTIAPSIAWDYGPDGNLLIEYQHTYSDEPLDRGIFYIEGAEFFTGEDNFAPRTFSQMQSTNVQESHVDRFDIRLSQDLGANFGIDLAYQRIVEDGFEFQAQFARIRDLYEADGLTYNGSTAPVRYGGSRDEETKRAIDNISAVIRGQFEIGITEHEIRLGYQRSDAIFEADFRGNGGVGRRIITNTLDIFNPDNDQEITFDGRNNNLFFTDSQDVKSFFAQWSGNFDDRIRIVAGLRHDEADFFTRFDTTDGLGTPSPNFSEEISFRVAGSYDLTDRLTAFAGYSDSYTPQNGTTADLEPIEALHNISYEVGLKAELFSDRVLWTNTVYQITQKNIAAVDPNDETNMFQIPFGEVRIRGFESEFVGAVTNTLDVSAGVALQESENVRTEDASVEGNEFFGVPNYQLSAFANYRLADLGLPDLAVRTGVIHVGDREGNAENNFELPAFTRVDFGLRYTLNSQTDFDLFVENLFDEIYYEQTQGRSRPENGIIPGDRRLVQFNVTHRF